MRPGVLGALGWLLLVPALYLTAFQKVTLRSLRDAWRGPNALLGELDESLACDLVTDFVRAQNEFARRVTCEGQVVASRDVATLTNVKVDWETRSYCLARTPSWTVLRTTGVMPCFPTPPPDLNRAVASEQERLTTAATNQMRERLDGILRAMASELRPAKCARKDGTSTEVPVLEFELLQGGDGAPAWAFLSTPWLREAVLHDTPPKQLAALERWSQGRPWVAVVTSQHREEARGGSLGTPWKRGRLDGTLSLIDAEAGVLLCEAPFGFTSSASLPPPPKAYGRGRINIAPIVLYETEERVQADFRQRYQSTAMDTLSKLTSYGVRASIY
jgi:hypothetical protein